MISREKFEAYQEVRESGLTNMFNLDNVIFVAGSFSNADLTKKDCIEIMGKYGKLKKKYGK